MLLWLWSVLGPVFLVPEDIEELLIAPQPCTYPSFLDHGQSHLIAQGKGLYVGVLSLTFSTTLIITIVPCWSVQTVVLIFLG